MHPTSAHHRPHGPAVKGVLQYWGQQGFCGPGQLVLEICGPALALWGQMAQGPSKCCGTAWESEVWSRPRAVPNCFLQAILPHPARCQASSSGQGPFILALCPCTRHHLLGKLLGGHTRLLEEASWTHQSQDHK